jgi:hypothetical protein
MGMAGGGAHDQCYRLDDLWLVKCSYTDADDKLLQCRLFELLQDVWVSPPHAFTGTWTTYFVNGLKSHEIVYRDGSYATFMSYFPSGSPAGIQTYDRHGAVIDEIDYYPSGRVRVRGLYPKGRRGVWTWYNEDGSIQSRYAP